jgi:hypothetical protein
MRRSLKLGLLTAALLAWAAVPARAGILPVSATILPESENFRYTYGVVLTSDSVLNPGDFFTLYDFNGYVNGSVVTPDHWTFSTSPTGGNPAGTVPGDDPTIPNMTFTYNGDPLTGQLGLGNFMLTSNLGDTGTTAFTARTNRQVDGAVDANITDVLSPIGGLDPGPGPDPSPTPGVPEPATLVLLGIGLPLAGAARYLRGKRAA